MNIPLKLALSIALMSLPVTLWDSSARAAAALPGGANSLNETHGDWSLRCQVQGAAASAAIKCSVSQAEIDKSSRRRVLTLVLNPEAGGGVKGLVMMPFGLSLDQGATFQLDGGAVTSPTHFRTCVPAGCIVPVEWPEATVKAMRSATTLKIGAVMDNGNPTPFSISMNGFASAIDRAVDLSGLK